MSTKLEKVIISGGGTGGHIFPAVAIADAIKKRYPDVDILFVGAENRMEMKRVPEAGYEIVGLDISGFDRQNLLRNFAVLWRLFKSFFKARRILKKFKPQVAVGVGGYASAATLKMANWLNIPTVIQEQNSYAGVTNKFLAKKASRICVAYDKMDAFFPKDRIVLTGNPCRQDLLNLAITREEAAAFFNVNPAKKTILVIGGSLGAQTINRSLSKDIEKIAGLDVQIIWQCGARYITELTLRLESAGNPENIRLYDFISRMDLAYKAADLVISRAGASSISELSLLEKPVILIPSPNVAEDHQTKNANALVEKDAAILIADKDANDQLLATALETVQDDTKLKTLSQHIAQLAQRDSAERIVDEIVKIIDKK
ncbi:undecaprenyldiphospho-muramoylpentapeptide beta-N-acetylglucosaminyltransferase [Dysgonomonas sp. 25]|uniref:undecaprenyldiphospho-muramoylpentapeptide beta-N-acetylglucosaminyltransferase n=1 Tax=Dysgonomonas sp. 25 TaxID=2302933 RepID=UPI0013D1AE58|nr:undecaprenyldiphospho-muramoylpentapeptide beta-N-acetylglucosaminyltransferase [Dysgonomonas sp. 25]NDV68706.1 undecaprenyldiphospho-muramoylpentapeptide beta-N-acetylglucosaminyltransferase [Dysgonomonas sp. 25]